MTADWEAALAGECAQPYWTALQTFVRAERAAGPVYPAADAELLAFALTSLADTKVVILGQDPYHGAGQAHGLSFSVPRDVSLPPSLVNIFKELASDLGVARPAHGNLAAWAAHGVLLLNTVLTVRANEAHSHRGHGWERFTDAAIRVLSAQPTPVVFLLWGSPAQRKTALIDTARHIVLPSPHPSPLSAHRGFFGSRPFSRANAALVAAGRTPIDWSLS